MKHQKQLGAVRVIRENDRVGGTAGYFLGQIIWKCLRFVLFVALTFVILYPIAFMVSMSLRQPADIMDPSVIWIPKRLVWDNVPLAVGAISYWKVLGNTLFLCISCSVIQVLICSFVGYGLSRFAFKGRSLLLFFLLLTIVVPPQLISLPTYFTFQDFDLFGLIRLIKGSSSGISILGGPLFLVIMVIFGQGLRSGLFILMYRQLYTSLPSELEEASMVDGGGFLKTYFRIMLPNATTITVVVFLFSLVWYWNDYYLTSVYAGDFSTLSMVLSNLRASFDSMQYDAFQMVVMEQASCLLFILPLLILYIFTQRFFTEGIERTGIVG